MQQHSGHTLKAFDEDIDRLRALISQMGGLAEHAIGEAMRCLVDRRVAGDDLLGGRGVAVDEGVEDVVDHGRRPPRHLRQ